MQRRDFAKTLALATLASLGPVYSTDHISPKPLPKKRIFKITLKHKIKQRGKNTRIWIPLPLQTEYQNIISPFSWDGNFKQAFISNMHIPTLYAEFDTPQADINISFTIQVPSYHKVTKIKLNKQEIASYLHQELQNRVQEIALKCTKNAKTPMQKARSIYEWIATADENGIDLKTISKSLISTNSIFVAMCKSIGIPAREVFGIRLGYSFYSGAMGSATNNLSDITSNQHSKSEFYIHSLGWVPCDVDDVIATKLVENLDIKSKRFKETLDYCFGQWEMCWMALNHTNTPKLTPMPANMLKSNFSHPYIEVDGKALSCKPEGYDYQSYEIL